MLLKLLKSLNYEAAAAAAAAEDETSEVDVVFLKILAKKIKVKKEMVTQNTASIAKLDMTYSVGPFKLVTRQTKGKP